MGKRSSFDRVERDFYPTPYEACVPLFPHLEMNYYYEPCVGDGALLRHIQVQWSGYSDIEKNALTLTNEDLGIANFILTNPPWSRHILHPMIEHFTSLRPTWLLIDADWMHTKQSIQYMKLCQKIISIGRVKWIPNSKMTGKDNCCWYLFDKDFIGETSFYGREY